MMCSGAPGCVCRACYPSGWEKDDETVRLLSQAGESYPHEQVRAMCVSLASFIAEIDASSADVAAYIEQRLGRLLLIAYRNGGYEEFGRALSDTRKIDRLAGIDYVGPGGRGGER